MAYRESGAKVTQSAESARTARANIRAHLIGRSKAVVFSSVKPDLITVMLAASMIALSAFAQSAKDVKGATPLIAIQNEPPARLIVDPPIPEQLALGRVFIQYRTENLRILPVFGKTALEVSPRVGHLHYYVDGQTWPIVDTSGETVVLVGLPPGPHQVRLELADTTHKPIPGCSKVVEFTIPSPQK